MVYGMVNGQSYNCYNHFKIGGPSSSSSSQPNVAPTTTPETMAPSLVELNLKTIEAKR